MASDFAEFTGTNNETDLMETGAIIAIGHLFFIH